MVDVAIVMHPVQVVMPKRGLVRRGFEGQGVRCSDGFPGRNGNSKVLWMYFCRSHLIILLTETFHGQFLGLKVIVLVVVIISNKSCFELVFLGIWV
jgi:hypothetical protein